MAAAAIPFAIKGLSSLFGGLQSRSAINDAVAALLNSYNKAGGIASDTVNAVNPNIYANADIWGNKMIDTGNAAADAASAAADRGISGINSAVTSGQGAINPFVTTGTGAASTLSNLLQNPAQFNFQADPGYQFRLQQGQQAINRSAAARGAAGGSGTAKSLAQFGSSLASQEYQNAWNRWNTGQQQRIAGLENLAGMGERGAEYSGDLGLRGATTGAGLGVNAAQYGGNARMGTTGAASNLWSHATDEMSQNSLDLGNFLANLAMKSGSAQAQGDLGRAGIWNSILGSAGSDLSSLPWAKILGGRKGGWGAPPGDDTYGGGYG